MASWIGIGALAIWGIIATLAVASGANHEHPSRR